MVGVSLAGVWLDEELSELLGKFSVGQICTGVVILLRLGFDTLDEIGFACIGG